MTRIFVVRHGRTAWNSQKRYQGQQDIPLDDVGRRQADALARRLSREPMTAVYSSDLERAMQTAQTIAKVHQIEPRPVASLRELAFGEFEGKTSEELERDLPVELESWRRNSMKTRPPGGETMLELDARVRSWFSATIGEHEDEAVAIVAHGGPVRRLVALLLNLSLDSYWRIRVDNAALTVFESGTSGYVMTALNDVCHLEEHLR